MKSIYYGLLFVGAIMALAFLSGCQKRDISNGDKLGNHLVLVDPEDPETYQFAIFGNEEAWVIIKNGEAYEFWIIGDTIYVESRLDTIKQSWHYKDMYYGSGSPLQVTGKNRVSHPYSGSYSDIFEFKY